MSAINKLDVDFFLQDDGAWDLELDTDGDLKGSNSIDTAVLMSLFTDKRASSDEISEPGQRRGWFGNLFNDDITYEIGSLIWLYSNQGRLDDELVNNLNDKALDSLNWMITDNVVNDIKANSSITSNNQVTLNLKCFIGQNIIERNYTLWENSRWL